MLHRIGVLLSGRGSNFEALADSLAAEPRNLGIRQATLEDVFLDLTGRALRD